MSDHDRIHELLERTAPDRPDLEPGARAAAVARRGRAARRRDRGLVAVAAVAVVAVAVGVPLALQGRDGGGASEVASSPADPDVAACPATPVDVGGLAATPGDVAPGDVVSVRSCPTSDPTDLPLGTDPLTGADARAFVEDVAALPAYEMESYCALASMKAEPWALQVQTADGQTFVVGSTMRGCASVPFDGVQRGVAPVVAAFEGNLQRQTTFDARGPDCPTSKRLAEGADTWNSSFDPATATGGALCYRTDPMGSRVYLEDDGGLGEAGLAVVRDDLVEHLGAPSGEGGCIDTGPQRLLVLTDDHGDRAAWLDDDCTGEFTGPGGSWKPGAAAEAAIEEALGGPAR
jgi:hypothetical protein